MYGNAATTARNQLLLPAAVFAALLAPTAQAKITNFTEPHTGVLMGAALFYHPLRPLAHDNAFDPVPALAPAGTTVSGSDGAWLLPIKVGVFRDIGEMVFDVYGIYQTSFRGTWTATGGATSGTSRFGGVGGGLQAAYYPWLSEETRFGFATNFEYYKQSLELTATSASGVEVADLATTSMLLGVGPQADFWLGDMWELSIFAGYQWGMASKWSATADTTFFGQAVSKGALKNARDGSGVQAQFGGLLIQAELKLNFP